MAPPSSEQISKFATNNLHISQLCMIGFAYKSYVMIGYCKKHFLVSFPCGIKIRSQRMFDSTSYPGSFFGKDPGCGWSRASSKI